MVYHFGRNTVEAGDFAVFDVLQGVGEVVRGEGEQLIITVSHHIIHLFYHFLLVSPFSHSWLSVLHKLSSNLIGRYCIRLLLCLLLTN